MRLFDILAGIFTPDAEESSRSGPEKVECPQCGTIVFNPASERCPGCDADELPVE